MKIPFVGKKAFKRRERECRLCPEDDYSMLDTHRIIFQGEYSNRNCVCLCTKCHRKVHTGKIKIIGWKHSTIGRILHYIDETGKEQFK